MGSYKSENSIKKEKRVCRVSLAADGRALVVYVFGVIENLWSSTWTAMDAAASYLERNMHSHMQLTGNSFDSRHTVTATATIPTTMDTEQRLQAVSNFLLQSPPGEINDVLNGMRVRYCCSWAIY
jgi:hypothetical protein